MSGAVQRKERVTAVSLVGISLLYLFGSLRLRWGTLKYPGAGFVPVVVGGLLLLCTVIYTMRVFSARRAEKRETETTAEAINYRAIVGVLACMIGYALVLESLKYIVSTFAMTLIMLVLLRPQRPMISLVTALAIAVVSFIILCMLFEVALPFGLLENLVFQIGRRLFT